MTIWDGHWKHWKYMKTKSKNLVGWAVYAPSIYHYWQQMIGMYSYPTRFLNIANYTLVWSIFNSLPLCLVVVSTFHGLLLHVWKLHIVWKSSRVWRRALETDVSRGNSGEWGQAVRLHKRANCVLACCVCTQYSLMHYNWVCLYFYDWSMCMHLCILPIKDKSL